MQLELRATKAHERDRRVFEGQVCVRVCVCERERERRQSERETGGCLRGRCVCVLCV